MTDNTTDTSPKKMNLESLDISEQRRIELKLLFPDVFTETKNDKGELVEGIDFEKLKAELGSFSDVFESRRERYGMDWSGKKDCMKLIQHPSIATLKPCRDESVNFDETENLFIEGDNLEVLKLLQKSYYSKVQMIYIDPPYNTGKEFIYPDKYSESLDTYLSYAGLADDEGKKFSTNTENEGRYHTKWLNMMYPRLYLARNLMCEDGVIFISIDDNEATNLRRLCDDIFGEENFIATIAWKHTQQSKNDEKYFSRHFNQIVVYGKSDSVLAFRFERTEEDNKNYSNPDNDPKGKWRSGDVRSPHLRKNLCFQIKTASGKKIEPPENGWRWSQKEVQKKIASGEIVFNDDETRVIRKIYLCNQKGRTPENIWDGDKFGTTRIANAEIKKLFDGKAVFDTPKPSQLIKAMVGLFYGNNDFTILDFFSGSCSTAHGILDTNTSDNGNRKFIMVQLPEPCDEKSEAFKAGYKNIADIGKERIRRVIKKIKEEQSGKLALDGDNKQDLGFKVFKLDQSNFDIWDGTNPDASSEEIAKQLSLYVDHIDPDATPEDILYELLLKSGYKPTEKVEKITLADKTVYSIAEGGILICLEEEITRELIDAVAEAEPQRFICLDKGFQGNDQLKANAVQTFAARNQGRETEHQIEFRTV